MTRWALTFGVLLSVSVLASSGSAQVSASRFGITIDGTEIPFASVASLGSSNDVVETTTTTGGGQVVIKRLPGKLRYRDITVVRPFSSDNALASWRALVEAGNIAAALKTGDLVGYNATGEPVIRYHLVNAWPASIEVYTDAQTGLLMETVTLVAEQVTRSAP